MSDLPPPPTAPEPKKVNRYCRSIDTLSLTAEYTLEIWEEWSGMVIIGQTAQYRQGLRLVEATEETHTFPLYDWEIRAVSEGWLPPADTYCQELPKDIGEIL